MNTDTFKFKFAEVYHFFLNLAGYLAISKVLLDWIWKGDDYGLFRSLIVVYLPIGLLTIWAVIESNDGKVLKALKSTGMKVTVEKDDKKLS